MEPSFNSFPGRTSMSGCMENCQKYIAQSHCSPIQGTLFVFLFKYGTDLSPCILHFRTLSSGLEKIPTFKWISESFPGTLIYLLILENCWNSPPMCSSSPIQETMSRLLLKFDEAWIWECHICKEVFSSLIIVGGFSWISIIPYSCVMCHVSGVMCHMSHVTCHMSHVTCNMSPVTCHLSPVTCHMSPVTCHRSHDTCHLSIVTFHKSPALICLHVYVKSFRGLAPYGAKRHTQQTDNSRTLQPIDWSVLGAHAVKTHLL